MLKATGWAISVKNRKEVKLYEEKIIADALGVKELHGKVYKCILA